MSPPLVRERVRLCDNKCDNIAFVRVGIRELSHHTSQYLSRVKKGDVLEVTERGRVIATIIPSSSEVAASDVPRPRPGGGQSGDPAAARRVDELLARGFGDVDHP